MAIRPPRNTSPKPDRDTKRGLKGDGLSFNSGLFNFVLNDKTYACAFMIGAVLLLLFIIGQAYILLSGETPSAGSSHALDNLWSAFLLCLGVMLGGKISQQENNDDD